MLLANISSYLLANLMHKPFKNWNSIKEKVDGKDDWTSFSEREVWWCSTGINVGVETDGKGDLFARPVIVFRKFNRTMFWALPMSTQNREMNPFYFHFNFHGMNRVIFLSQLRLLSSKRLIRKIGKISNGNFYRISSGIISLITKRTPN